MPVSIDMPGEEGDPLLDDDASVRRLEEQYKAIKMELKVLDESIRELMAAMAREEQTRSFIERCEVEHVQDILDNALSQVVDNGDPKSLMLLEAVDNMKDELGRRISTKFEGEFRHDGSSADGTKLGPLDELDFLYEVTTWRQHSDEDIQPILKDPTDARIMDTIYSVTSRGKELSSFDFFKDFATTVSDALRDMTLLGDLQLDIIMNHGGFGCPQYSGVRLNEPAVTVILLLDNRRRVSIDIAPAIRMPSAQNLNWEHYNNIRPNIRKIISDVSSFEYVSSRLHLIPSMYDRNAWYVSPSVLEADIIASIAPDAPVKRAIQKAKVLRDAILGNVWNQNDVGRCFWHSKSVDVVGRLLRRGRKQNAINKTSNTMRYSHMVLTKSLAAQHNELAKIEVAINTIAIKNHAFTEAVACEEGVFSPQGDDDTMALENILLLKIWAKLSEDGIYRVDNFFLPPNKIRIYAITAYAMDNWFDLLTIMKYHCKKVYGALYTMMARDMPEVVRRAAVREPDTQLHSGSEMPSTSRENLKIQAEAKVTEMKEKLTSLLDTLHGILETRHQFLDVDPVTLRPIPTAQPPDYSVPGNTPQSLPLQLQVRPAPTLNTAIQQNIHLWLVSS